MNKPKSDDIWTVAVRQLAVMGTPAPGFLNAALGLETGLELEGQKYPRHQVYSARGRCANC